ncbi:MAG: flagellar motor protein MotB [Planctomycetota bacterium]
MRVYDQSQSKNPYLDELDHRRPNNVPEWVVTFGDMMSLLLTFFIMLVSLSEIKEEETYQALVDSMRQQFGYDRSIESLTPGSARPRTTAYHVLATVGRAKRADTDSGGVPQPAPYGDQQHVRMIRPGALTAVGTVLSFADAETQLTDQNRETLRIVAERLRDKPQRIEIRGHTAPSVASRSESPSESMVIAFQRSSAVMQYLIDECELPARRFRLSSASDHEPTPNGRARVEVFLLDESTPDPTRVHP